MAASFRLAIFSGKLETCRHVIVGRSQGVRIAKILQNIRNGVRFGSKAQFMIPFSEIIDESAARLQSTLTEDCPPL